MFDLEHLSTHGSVCVLFEFTPSAAPPLMHATNSLDYLVVLSGRARLALETESVDLGPGDLVIDRGVLHGWGALDDRPAQILGVSVKARPVGPGARVIAQG